MTIAEKQLGQSRPANTTAASIYSPGASITGIVKQITVCNTTTSPAKARIFLDNDGTTYDESTALWWDVTLEGNEVKEYSTFKPMNNSAGNLAVRTNKANALTFTVHGAEIS